MKISKALLFTAILTTLTFQNSKSIAKNLNSNDTSNISSDENLSSQDGKDNVLIRESTKKAFEEITKKSALTVAFERINGNANEIVYDKNKKLSDLDWDIKDVKMISFRYDRELSDVSSFGFVLSRNIDHGSEKAIMHDYDWLDPNNLAESNYDNWTHLSIHKIKVQTFEQYKLMYNHELYNKSIFGRIGINYEKIRWRDYLAKSIYSSRDFAYNLTGFRNEINHHNGERSIVYEQHFITPYIGLEYQKKFFDNKIHLTIFGNVSSLSVASDKDHHFKRELTFRGIFTGGKYTNFGASLTKNINENFSLGLAHEFTKYHLNKGDMQVENTKTGTFSDVHHDSAGISNEYKKTSLYLKYNF